MEILYKVLNFFLNLRAIVLGYLVGEGKGFVGDADIVFGDGRLIENKRLSEYWEKGLWWGDYREDERVVYVNSTNVRVMGRDKIRLRTEERFKENPFNGEWMYYSSGLLQSRYAYFDCRFEVRVCVSRSVGIWHAPLWFVSTFPDRLDELSVLPEIDVAEIYSDEYTRMRVESNVHCGEDYEEGSRTLGAMRHYVPRLSRGQFAKFGIDFNKNRIKIYVNGYLVRVVRDKAILERIGGLVPIIGTSVRKDYVGSHGGSYMDVDYIKYWGKGSRVLLRNYKE